MPTPEPPRLLDTALHQYRMVADVFGPVRPAPELHRRTQRALKGHTGGRDFFTDITLHDVRSSAGMRIEYMVTAASPAGAERAGAVYLSQLCDLISVVTRCPVWFYMPDEDSREERIRMHHRPSSVDRILSEGEWLWITGSLVYLRREHPRYLAAASWYRKGLIGSDALDDFCCYWRVIERLAYSYSDKSGWTEDERAKSAVKKCVQQLLDDLFRGQITPELLQNAAVVSKIIKMRNDLSHGNDPITLEIIEESTAFLKPLEDAAFSVLQGVRAVKFNSDLSN